MEHDVRHEVRQNNAIRRIAAAVADLSVGHGRSEYKGLGAEIDKLLTADEAEGSEGVIEARELAEGETLEEAPLPTGTKATRLVGELLQTDGPAPGPNDPGAPLSGDPSVA